MLTDAHLGRRAHSTYVAKMKVSWNTEEITVIDDLYYVQSSV